MAFLFLWDGGIYDRGGHQNGYTFKKESLIIFFINKMAVMSACVVFTPASSRKIQNEPMILLDFLLLAEYIQSLQHNYVNFHGLCFGSFTEGK